MSHDQLLLEFLGDEAKKPAAAAPEDQGPAAESQDQKEPKPRARRVSKLSESLKSLPTVVREIIHPDVLAAPDHFRLLGEETSERLHVKPSTFTLEIIKRLTHVRKNEVDAVPLTPPLAPCLLPGSVLTPSLGAHLLTQKFCYHSTFYREQWKLKAAHGIELTRNLMCSWHDHLADRLLPLYQLIAARLRAADYIKIDETPVRCLEPGAGKTASGYFWVYHHAEHGVLFDWHKSRANTCLDHILIGADGESSFNGHLQSDGLRAYRTFIERHPKLQIIPVSCLTHISRKFKEARDEHPRITARILLLTGTIYQIEKRLREEDAGPLDRQRARWLESRNPTIASPNSSAASPASAGSRREASLAKPWPTPPTNGRTLNPASWTARSSSTTISPKTPSGPPSSATRTGCSLAASIPVGAARSSTPSSSKSAAMERIRSPTSSGYSKS